MLAARTQTSMRISSYVTSYCSPLPARVPYVVLLPVNEDGNLQVCMYCMHTHSILWAPLFVFALGPSNPLGGPGLTSAKVVHCS